MSDDDIVCLDSSSDDETSMKKVFEKNDLVRPIFTITSEILFDVENLDDTAFPYDIFKKLFLEIKKIMSNSFRPSFKYRLWRKIILLLETIKTRFKKVKGVKDVVTYNFIVLDILVEYVDFRSEDVKEQIDNKAITSLEIMKECEVILTNLYIILDKNIDFILMLLLKINIKKEYAPILYPIFNKLLSDDTLHKANEIVSYIRLILCYKQWKKLVSFKEEKEKINIIAKRVLPIKLPPMSIKDRIFKDILPFIPNKKRENATSFLLFNQLLSVEDSAEKLFQAYVTADLNRSNRIRNKNPETSHKIFSGDSEHVSEIPSCSMLQSTSTFKDISDKAPSLCRPPSPLAALSSYTRSLSIVQNIAQHQQQLQQRPKQQPQKQQQQKSQQQKQQPQLQLEPPGPEPVPTLRGDSIFHKNLSICDIDLDATKYSNNNNNNSNNNIDNRDKNNISDLVLSRFSDKSIREISSPKCLPANISNQKSTKLVHSNESSPINNKILNKSIKKTIINHNNVQNNKNEVCNHSKSTNSNLNINYIANKQNSSVQSNEKSTAANKKEDVVIMILDSTDSDVIISVTETRLETGSVRKSSIHSRNQKKTKRILKKVKRVIRKLDDDDDEDDNIKRRKNSSRRKLKKKKGFVERLSASNNTDQSSADNETSETENERPVKGFLRSSRDIKKIKHKKIRVGEVSSTTDSKPQSLSPNKIDGSIDLSPATNCSMSSRRYTIDSATEDNNISTSDSGIVHKTTPILNMDNYQLDSNDSKITPSSSSAKKHSDNIQNMIPECSSNNSSEEGKSPNLAYNYESCSNMSNDLLEDEDRPKVIEEIIIVPDASQSNDYEDISDDETILPEEALDEFIEEMERDLLNIEGSSSSSDKNSTDIIASQSESSNSVIEIEDDSTTEFAVINTLQPAETNEVPSLEIPSIEEKHPSPELLPLITEVDKIIEVSEDEIELNSDINLADKVIIDTIQPDVVVSTDTAEANDEKTVKITNETIVEARDKTIVEAGNDTNLEASNEAIVEVRDETIVGTEDETIVEVGNETNLEASNEAIIEVRDETIVEAANDTNLEASNETIVEVRDETIVGTEDETIVEAGNDTNLEAINEAIVEVRDETIVGTENETIVEAANDTIVEAMDEAIVEIRDEAIVEVRNETNVEAINESIDEQSNHDLSSNVLKSNEVIVDDITETIGDFNNSVQDTIPGFPIDSELNSVSKILSFDHSSALIPNDESEMERLSVPFPDEDEIVVEISSELTVTEQEVGAMEEISSESDLYKDSETSENSKQTNVTISEELAIIVEDSLSNLSLKEVSEDQLEVTSTEVNFSKNVEDLIEIETEVTAIEVDSNRNAEELIVKNMLKLTLSKDCDDLCMDKPNQFNLKECSEESISKITDLSASTVDVTSSSEANPELELREDTDQDEQQVTFENNIVEETAVISEQIINESVPYEISDPNPTKIDDQSSDLVEKNNRDTNPHDFPQTIDSKQCDKVNDISNQDSISYSEECTLECDITEKNLDNQKKVNGYYNNLLKTNLQINKLNTVPSVITEEMIPFLDVPIDLSVPHKASQDVIVRNEIVERHPIEKEELRITTRCCVEQPIIEICTASALRIHEKIEKIPSDDSGIHNAQESEPEPLILTKNSVNLEPEIITITDPALTIIVPEETKGSNVGDPVYVNCASTDIVVNNSSKTLVSEQNGAETISFDPPNIEIVWINNKDANEYKSNTIINTDYSYAPLLVNLEMLATTALDKIQEANKSDKKIFKRDKKGGKKSSKMVEVLRKNPDSKRSLRSTPTPNQRNTRNHCNQKEIEENLLKAGCLMQKTNMDANKKAAIEVNNRKTKVKFDLNFNQDIWQHERTSEILRSITNPKKKSKKPKSILKKTNHPIIFEDLDETKQSSPPYSSDDSDRLIIDLETERELERLEPNRFSKVKEKPMKKRSKSSKRSLDEIVNVLKKGVETILPPIITYSDFIMENNAEIKNLIKNKENGLHLVKEDRPSKINNLVELLPPVITDNDCTEIYNIKKGLTESVPKNNSRYGVCTKCPLSLINTDVEHFKLTEKDVLPESPMVTPTASIFDIKQLNNENHLEEAIIPDSISITTETIHKPSDMFPENPNEVVIGNSQIDTDQTQSLSVLTYAKYDEEEIVEKEGESNLAIDEYVPEPIKISSSPVEVVEEVSTQEIAKEDIPTVYSKEVAPSVEGDNDKDESVSITLTELKQSDSDIPSAEEDTFANNLQDPDSKMFHNDEVTHLCKEQIMLQKEESSIGKSMSSQEDEVVETIISSVNVEQECIDSNEILVMESVEIEDTVAFSEVLSEEVEIATRNVNSGEDKVEQENVNEQIENLMEPVTIVAEEEQLEIGVGCNEAIVETETPKINIANVDVFESTDVKSSDVKDEIETSSLPNSEVITTKPVSMVDEENAVIVNEVQERFLTETKSSEDEIHEVVEMIIEPEKPEVIVHECKNKQDEEIFEKTEDIVPEPQYNEYKELYAKTRKIDSEHETKQDAAMPEKTEDNILEHKIEQDLKMSENIEQENLEIVEECEVSEIIDIEINNSSILSPNNEEVETPEKIETEENKPDGDAGTNNLDAIETSVAEDSVSDEKMISTEITTIEENLSDRNVDTINIDASETLVAEKVINDNEMITEPTMQISIDSEVVSENDIHVEAKPEMEENSDHSRVMVEEEATGKETSHPGAHKADNSIKSYSMAIERVEKKIISTTQDEDSMNTVMENYDVITLRDSRIDLLSECDENKEEVTVNLDYSFISNDDDDIAETVTIDEEISTDIDESIISLDKEEISCLDVQEDQEKTTVASVSVMEENSQSVNASEVVEIIETEVVPTIETEVVQIIEASVDKEEFDKIASCQTDEHKTKVAESIEEVHPVQNTEDLNTSMNSECENYSDTEPIPEKESENIHHNMNSTSSSGIDVDENVESQNADTDFDFPSDVSVINEVEIENEIIGEDDIILDNKKSNELSNSISDNSSDEYLSANSDISNVESAIEENSNKVITEEIEKEAEASKPIITEIEIVSNTMKLIHTTKDDTIEKSKFSSFEFTSNFNNTCNQIVLRINTPDMAADERTPIDVEKTEYQKPFTIDETKVDDSLMMTEDHIADQETVSKVIVENTHAVKIDSNDNNQLQNEMIEEFSTLDDAMISIGKIIIANAGNKAILSEIEKEVLTENESEVETEIEDIENTPPEIEIDDTIYDDIGHSVVNEEIVSATEDHITIDSHTDIPMTLPEYLDKIVENDSNENVTNIETIDSDACTDGEQVSSKKVSENVQLENVIATTSISTKDEILVNVNSKADEISANATIITDDEITNEPILSKIAENADNIVDDVPLDPITDKINEIEPTNLEKDHLEIVVDEETKTKSSPSDSFRAELNLEPIDEIESNSWTEVNVQMSHENNTFEAKIVDDKEEFPNEDMVMECVTKIAVVIPEFPEDNNELIIESTEKNEEASIEAVAETVVSIESAEKKDGLTIETAKEKDVVIIESDDEVVEEIAEPAEKVINEFVQEKDKVVIGSAVEQNTEIIAAEDIQIPTDILDNKQHVMEVNMDSQECIFETVEIHTEESTIDSTEINDDPSPDPLKDTEDQLEQYPAIEEANGSVDFPIAQTKPSFDIDDNNQECVFETVEVETENAMTEIVEESEESTMDPLQDQLEELEQFDSPARPSNASEDISNMSTESLPIINEVVTEKLIFRIEPQTSAIEKIITEDVLKIDDFEKSTPIDSSTEGQVIEHQKVITPELKIDLESTVNVSVQNSVEKVLQIDNLVDEQSQIKASEIDFKFVAPAIEPQIKTIVKEKREKPKIEIISVEIFPPTKNRTKSNTLQSKIDGSEIIQGSECPILIDEIEPLPKRIEKLIDEVIVAPDVALVKEICSKEVTVNNVEYIANIAEPTKQSPLSCDKSINHNNVDANACEKISGTDVLPKAEEAFEIPSLNLQIPSVVENLKVVEMEQSVSPTKDIDVEVVETIKSPETPRITIRSLSTINKMEFGHMCDISKRFEYPKNVEVPPPLLTENEVRPLSEVNIPRIPVVSYIDLDKIKSIIGGIDDKTETLDDLEDINIEEIDPLSTSTVENLAREVQEKEIEQENFNDDRSNDLQTVAQEVEIEMDQYDVAQELEIGSTNKTPVYGTFENILVVDEETGLMKRTVCDDLFDVNDPNYRKRYIEKFNSRNRDNPIKPCFVKLDRNSVSKLSVNAIKSREGVVQKKKTIKRKIEEMAKEDSEDEGYKDEEQRFPKKIKSNSLEIELEFLKKYDDIFKPVDVNDTQSVFDIMVKSTKEANSRAILLAINNIEFILISRCFHTFILQNKNFSTNISFQRTLESFMNDLKLKFIDDKSLDELKEKYKKLKKMDGAFKKHNLIIHLDKFLKSWTNTRRNILKNFHMIDKDLKLDVTKNYKKDDEFRTVNDILNVPLVPLRILMDTDSNDLSSYDTENSNASVIPNEEIIEVVKRLNVEKPVDKVILEKDVELPIGQESVIERANDSCVIPSINIVEQVADKPASTQVTESNKLQHTPQITEILPVSDLNLVPNVTDIPQLEVLPLIPVVPTVNELPIPTVPPVSLEPTVANVAEKLLNDCPATKSDFVFDGLYLEDDISNVVTNSDLTIDLEDRINQEAQKSRDANSGDFLDNMMREFVDFNEGMLDNLYQDFTNEYNPFNKDRNCLISGGYDMTMTTTFHEYNNLNAAIGETSPNGQSVNMNEILDSSRHSKSKDKDIFANINMKGDDVFLDSIIPNIAEMDTVPGDTQRLPFGNNIMLNATPPICFNESSLLNETSDDSRSNTQFDDCTEITVDPTFEKSMEKPFVKTEKVITQIIEPLKSITTDASTNVKLVRSILPNQKSPIHDHKKALLRAFNFEEVTDISETSEVSENELLPATLQINKPKEKPTLDTINFDDIRSFTCTTLCNNIKLTAEEPEKIANVLPVMPIVPVMPVVPKKMVEEDIATKPIVQPLSIVQETAKPKSPIAPISRKNSNDFLSARRILYDTPLSQLSGGKVYHDSNLKVSTPIPVSRHAPPKKVSTPTKVPSLSFDIRQSSTDKVEEIPKSSEVKVPIIIPDKSLPKSPERIKVKSKYHDLPLIELEDDHSPPKKLKYDNSDSLLSKPKIRTVLNNKSDTLPNGRLQPPTSSDELFEKVKSSSPNNLPLNSVKYYPVQKSVASAVISQTSQSIIPSAIPTKSLDITKTNNTVITKDDNSPIKITKVYASDLKKTKVLVPDSSTIINNNIYKSEIRSNSKSPNINLLDQTKLIPKSISKPSVPSPDIPLSAKVVFSENKKLNNQTIPSSDHKSNHVNYSPQINDSRKPKVVNPIKVEQTISPPDLIEDYKVIKVSIANSKSSISPQSNSTSTVFVDNRRAKIPLSNSSHSHNNVKESNHDNHSPSPRSDPKRIKLESGTTSSPKISDEYKSRISPQNNVSLNKYHSPKTNFSPSTNFLSSDSNKKVKLQKTIHSNSSYNLNKHSSYSDSHNSYSPKPDSKKYRNSISPNTSSPSTLPYHRSKTTIGIVTPPNTTSSDNKYDSPKNVHPTTYGDYRRMRAQMEGKSNDSPKNVASPNVNEQIKSKTSLGYNTTSQISTSSSSSSSSISSSAVASSLSSSSSSASLQSQHYNKHRSNTNNQVHVNKTIPQINNNSSYKSTVNNREDKNPSLTSASISFTYTKAMNNPSSVQSKVHVKSSSNSHNNIHDIKSNNRTNSSNDKRHYYTSFNDLRPKKEYSSVNSSSGGGTSSGIVGSSSSASYNNNKTEMKIFSNSHMVKPKPHVYMLCEEVKPTITQPWEPEMLTTEQIIENLRNQNKQKNYEQRNSSKGYLFP